MINSNESYAVETRKETLENYLGEFMAQEKSMLSGTAVTALHERLDCFFDHLLEKVESYPLYEGAQVSNENRFGWRRMIEESPESGFGC